jgi:arginine repressor
MAEKPEVNRSQAIREFFQANPKAKTQEVVDDLAKQGITVTTGLVRTIKSTHNQRQTARKAAKTAATTHPVAGATITNKKPEVSKTQAVHDYLMAHKKAKNAEVVAALAQRGITITIGYVRTIKAKKNQRRRAVRTVVAKAGIGIPEVKAALAFIKSVGSVAAAKQAFTVAQDIKKIV